MFSWFPAFRQLLRLSWKRMPDLQALVLNQFGFLLSDMASCTGCDTGSAMLREKGVAYPFLGGCVNSVHFSG